MITLTVETAALDAGLTDLAATMATDTKAASEVTAAAIVREARGRVARRTGRTAAGIGYMESRDGTGYIVHAVHPDRPRLPLYLEFGTRYMTARPFLYVSAAIEQPGHERRMADAVTTAIDVSGFGG